MRKRQNDLQKKIIQEFISEKQDDPAESHADSAEFEAAMHRHESRHGN